MMRGWRSSMICTTSASPFLPPIHPAASGTAYSWLTRNSAAERSVHGSSADLLCCSLWRYSCQRAAVAHTAIDDRVILATVVLRQATPNEALCVTPSTGPVLGGDFTNSTPGISRPAGSGTADSGVAVPAEGRLIMAMRKQACRCCWEKDNRATRDRK